MPKDQSEPNKPNVLFKDSQVFKALAVVKTAINGFAEKVKGESYKKQYPQTRAVIELINKHFDKNYDRVIKLVGYFDNKQQPSKLDYLPIGKTLLKLKSAKNDFMSDMVGLLKKECKSAPELLKKIKEIPKDIEKLQPHELLALMTHILQLPEDLIQALLKIIDVSENQLNAARNAFKNELNPRHPIYLLSNACWDNFKAEEANLKLEVANLAYHLATEASTIVHSLPKTLEEVIDFMDLDFVRKMESRAIFLVLKDKETKAAIAAAQAAKAAKERDAKENAVAGKESKVEQPKEKKISQDSLLDKIMAIFTKKNDAKIVEIQEKIQAESIFKHWNYGVGETIKSLNYGILSSLGYLHLNKIKNDQVTAVIADLLNLHSKKDELTAIHAELKNLTKELEAKFEPAPTLAKMNEIQARFNSEYKKLQKLKEQYLAKLESKEIIDTKGLNPHDKKHAVVALDSIKPILIQKTNEIHLGGKKFESSLIACQEAYVKAYAKHDALPHKDFEFKEEAKAIAEREVLLSKLQPGNIPHELSTYSDENKSLFTHTRYQNLKPYLYQLQTKLVAFNPTDQDIIALEVKELNTQEELQFTALEKLDPTVTADELTRVMKEEYAAIQGKLLNVRSEALSILDPINAIEKANKYEEQLVKLYRQVMSKSAALPLIPGIYQANTIHYNRTIKAYLNDVHATIRQISMQKELNSYQKLLDNQESASLLYLEVGRDVLLNKWVSEVPAELPYRNAEYKAEHKLARENAIFELIEKFQTVIAVRRLQPEPVVVVNPVIVADVQDEDFDCEEPQFHDEIIAPEIHHDEEVQEPEEIQEEQEAEQDNQSEKIEPNSPSEQKGQQAIESSSVHYSSNSDDSADQTASPSVIGNHENDENQKPFKDQIDLIIRPAIVQYRQELAELMSSLMPKDKAYKVAQESIRVLAALENDLNNPKLAPKEKMQKYYSDLAANVHRLNLKDNRTINFIKKSLVLLAGVAGFIAGSALLVLGPIAAQRAYSYAKHSLFGAENKLKSNTRAFKDAIAVSREPDILSDHISTDVREKLFV